MPLGQQTLRLPGGILLTVIPLTDHRQVRVLRAATHADLYILFGQTFAPPADEWDFPTSTGPGGYVGLSLTLCDAVRAGVSLQEWWTQREQLQPQLAILIRRPGRPFHPDLVRWTEIALIRRLWEHYTLLNTVSSCPTVAARLPRHQVLFGLWLVDRLLDLLRGRILPRGVAGAPVGGPTREQLVRLVRHNGPLTASELVAEARTLGLPVSAHGDPEATTRRDLCTREPGGSRGPTRIRHTHVTGPAGRPITLFYPPSLSRAAAICAWRLRHNLPVSKPRRHRPRQRLN